MTTEYTRATPDERTLAALHGLWDAAIAHAHPEYALPEAKFASLLAHPRAMLFVATCKGETMGFALGYTIPAGSRSGPQRHLKGTLALVVVHPAHRGRGVGTALHGTALDALDAAVRPTLGGVKSSIQLGSTFPRIFPGVPTTLDVGWFERRGWKMGEKAIDLFARLPVDVDLDALQARAREHGVSFRPATEADRAEIVEFQKEFDSFTGWPDMFPAFLDAGRAGDIHLAIKHGAIVGATLAALPGSPLHAGLAWPDTLGSACGGIACVGVTAKSRGDGAGVGMVASAVQRLTERGADGCFIDWVSMVGFYERFGLRQWAAPYVCSEREVLPKTEAGEGKEGDKGGCAIL